MSTDHDRIDIAAAIARAGYDGSDNVDLWQWRECVDHPNCVAKPCACSGVPYISDAVWAELGLVIHLIRKREWAAGRTAAAADLAATFERITDSEAQSLLGTPPEYPTERTMRSGRCAAFKRAAEIAREAR